MFSDHFWLETTFLAFFLYGIGQGLLKQYVGDVSAYRFCLYAVPTYFLADAVFYLLYMPSPNPFAAEGRQFMYYALTLCLLEGVAYVCYYESIAGGLISIVGTVSAAYPAVTVVYAYFILDETLSTKQYIGVFMVIAGCIGIAYEPSDPDQKVSKRRVLGMPVWFLQALIAALGWGIGAGMTRYAFEYTENASEGNMALFGFIGYCLPLAVYGAYKEKDWKFPKRQMALAFTPLMMIAIGDVILIISYKYGLASIVTPVSGAYPALTIVYAFFVLKEKLTPLQWVFVTIIFVGMLMAPGAE
ncbi:MAG: DMT family transporter [Acidobacteriota bacterium]|nr:MAG: DMT family transporter [Acidobacteriota bacterium]